MIQKGDGSNNDHFHVGFTSTKLINSIVENEAMSRGVFHIDATYKIVKYNYPLLVLGYTDLKGQFFPVAFMYTSHEKVEDFDHFFTSFMNVCNAFNFEFKPKYLVSDAWKATANSIARLLPETIHLMCYFHLKFNIRKRKIFYSKLKAPSNCLKH